MNLSILKPEIQQYINHQLYSDVTRLLLQKSVFDGVSTAELATQIDGKKRCEKKLPLWYTTPGIYYPPKLALEQASSQQTARYKSKLITGKTVADLTGGFGVDSYYFSLRADRVTYCETDAGLCAIAKHNAAVLGEANTSFINTNGIKWLAESTDVFDTVYIDPSRRVKSNKVFKLKDCEPNVPENLELLLKKTKRIVLKTAPLLDIQAGLNELRQVSQIHVISIKNDCKELLWIIDADYKGTEPVITCGGLSEGENQVYSFKSSEEKAQTISTFSKPLQFIYEPDVALLKAGCFKLIARDFEVLKLHPNTHIYTSDTFKPSFFGRTFKLRDSRPYKLFSRDNTPKQANVICRNFPLPVQEVKKKHKLRDGSDIYLIFTRGPQDELMVLECERILRY